MKLVDIKDNITSKQKLLLGIVCLLLIIVVFSVLKNVTSKNDKFFSQELTIYDTK